MAIVTINEPITAIFLDGIWFIELFLILLAVKVHWLEANICVEYSFYTMGHPHWAIVTVEFEQKNTRYEKLNHKNIETKK